MAESSSAAYYETLQIRPTAEPEVIDAAYRALAKKYHPDRSSAPDAEARMARINAAFQAVRGRGGRLTTPHGKLEAPVIRASRLSPEGVDPTAPLEEVLSQVTHIVTVARQQIIDEITGDGVSHDLAANLVAAALKSLVSAVSDSSRQRSRATGTGLDPAASYDEAIQFVTQKAQAMRDQLADQLAKDGLNRSAALELTDAAFERVRRGARSTSAQESRLTPDHVDLTGPLDSGVRVVGAKLRVARQMVLDELTRDGIPLRTAEQLVDAAGQAPSGRQRR